MPALNLAALYGNIEAVSNLVANGADLNKSSRGHRSTPLHEATHGGHAEIVKFLLDAGANDSLKDYAGNTALHIACRNNCVKIARILVMAPNSKAALSSYNACHQRPYEIAGGSFVGTLIENAMKANRISIEQRKSLTK
jgi:ankyrin repeat protein